MALGVVNDRTKSQSSARSGGANCGTYDMGSIHAPRRTTRKLAERVVEGDGPLADTEAV